MQMFARSQMQKNILELTVMQGVQNLTPKPHKQSRALMTLGSLRSKPQPVSIFYRDGYSVQTLGHLTIYSYPIPTFNRLRWPNMTCGCNCNKTPHTCHSNLHSRCSKPQPVIYSMEMDTNARRYTSHLSLCTSTHQPLYVTHYTKNIQQKCLLPEGGGGPQLLPRSPRSGVTRLLT